VTLHGDDHWAEIVVADDGVGGARAEDGSGLRGLGDRVDALGGRLTLTSTPRARHDRSRPRSNRQSERRRVLSARVGHSSARRGCAAGSGGAAARPVLEATVACGLVARVSEVERQTIGTDDMESSSLAAAALECSSPRLVRIRQAAPSSSGIEVGRVPSKE
jgi:hypothetical protein